MQLHRPYDEPQNPDPIHPTLHTGPLNKYIMVSLYYDYKLFSIEHNRLYLSLGCGTLRTFGKPAC